MTSCQVMYQSYYPYFNPYHHHQVAASPAASSPTASASSHHHHQALETSPPHLAHHHGGRSLEAEAEGSPNPNSPASRGKTKRLSYGDMQHPNESVYDHRGHHGGSMQPPMSPHHETHQSSYLSASSPLVHQPLPASTMAPSVAALQRLSASIDVTVSSRSNSRASAYEDNSNKSEKSEIRDDIIESEAGQQPQYLTANCVVYTFYSGDLTAAIDDHFNRALKRANNSSSGGGSSPEQHSESAKQQSDSPVPMSQRNLPPSFWVSDYYVQSHSHLQSQVGSGHPQGYPMQHQYDPYDAYVSAAASAADPWHNYMTSYHQHHRASADMYSARSQYSSLLHLQSSAIARQAHQQGRQVAAALGKAPSDSWAAAASAVAGSAAVDGFTSAAAAASTHPHYSAAMTGLEGTMQGPSKDLYWF